MHVSFSHCRGEVVAVSAIRKFIQGELKGWHWAEVSWLAFSVLLCVICSIVAGDSTIALIAAIAGTMYTMLAGKGKLSCYAFGVVNVLTYALISYGSRLYGEVMLNLFWYFPMMFVGAFLWSKHLSNNQIIQKERLGAGARFVAASLLFCGMVGFARFVLIPMGDPQPMVDSFTTVAQVVAMALTVRRCIEQWILWCIVNAVSIFMWARAAMVNGPDVMIVMWSLWFVNSIIFLIQWTKSTKTQIN